MEWLEFGDIASLGARQERVLRFVLPEGGECDGFHLSLRVQVDEETIIEADRQETTWASIYVRLRGGGLYAGQPASITLPPGGTIVAHCSSAFPRGDTPSYSVRLMAQMPAAADAGEDAEPDETEIGEFVWTGT